MEDRLDSYKLSIDVIGSYFRVESEDLIVLIKGDIETSIKKEDNGKPIIILESKQQ